MPKTILPVKLVSVKIDGWSYIGAYYVLASVVHLSCELGGKARSLDGSSAKGVATVLLNEVVQESRTETDGRKPSS